MKVFNIFRDFILFGERFMDNEGNWKYNVIGDREDWIKLDWKCWFFGISGKYNGK